MSEHALPPGQVAVEGFPRFGVDLRHPPPPVPPDPVLVVRGAGDDLELPLARLRELPRRSVEADLHCVAGWTATGLRWEGVAVADLYRELVEPRLAAGRRPTHLLFRGADGFCSVVQLRDALAPHVLLADTLDGAPLDGDHGAPLRLVSPGQYGYVSVKHLRRIEVHDSEPAGLRTTPLRRVQWWLLGLHPRGRVWLEERHPGLPARLVGPVYRRLASRIKQGLWSE